MKLLACVTTCDRPLLLRRSVESHLRLELFADASGYWAGSANAGLVSLRLVAERGFRLAGPENDTSELWRA